MLKLFARRKDGNQVLLKMGFLGDPKNPKDERGENWNYLKIRILIKIFTKWDLRKHFQNQMKRKPRMSHGPKVAHTKDGQCIAW